MTTHHHHAVIWIDHREARVFHFGPTDVDRLVIHPDHPTKHIHHKANSIGSGHAGADHEYLHAVTNRSPTPIPFSSPGRRMPRPSWSSTFTSTSQAR